MGQPQQLVGESLVGSFVLILVFKCLQGLNVVAQCDGLHAELREQFQELANLFRAFS